MTRISLDLDELLFVRGVLRHGFIRDRHPAWRASASSERVAFHDAERERADALLVRLDTVVKRIAG